MAVRKRPSCPGGQDGRFRTTFYGRHRGDTLPHRRETFGRESHGYPNGLTNFHHGRLRKRGMKCNKYLCFENCNILLFE